MSLPLLEPTPVRTGMLLRTPQRTVAVAGEAGTTVAGRGDDPSAADRVLAGLAAGGTAVGRLAFEPDGPMIFHPAVAHPAAVHPAVAHPAAAHPTEDDGPAPAPNPLLSGLPLPGLPLPTPRRPLPPDDATEFRHAVRAALSRLRDPRDPLRKVVLGRWLDLPWAADAQRTVAGLLATGAPFVFRLPGPDGSDLVGASPELLVRRTGRRVESHPLAGSVPRSDDPDQDAARAAGLLDSAKDLAEHEFVVRDILDRLRPWCTEVDAPARPTLLATDTMWHLGTPIRGTLADRPPSALHLARLLHPTPAVAGYPREAAQAAIGELEDRPRGVMTGAVGWVDGSGDGEFAVTIRSALLHRDRVELFAGAGIVADSDPEVEAAETGAKFRTVLRALVAR